MKFERYFYDPHFHNQIQSPTPSNLNLSPRPFRKDGSFSFIFNVCVSCDNPINPRSLPEDFVPIDPPIDPVDIRRFIVFKEGSYLASTSIEKSQDDTTSP